MASSSFAVEFAPPGFPADLTATIGSRHSLVKVLAAAAPHHRGGKGSLGLHWLLPETAADLVALIDLSRSMGWLLPVEDFRARAKPLPVGRYHLDWIVVPLGPPRTQLPSEADFEAYRFENLLAPAGGWRANLVNR